MSKVVDAFGIERRLVDSTARGPMEEPPGPSITIQTMIVTPDGSAFVVTETGITEHDLEERLDSIRTESQATAQHIFRRNR